MLRLHHHELIEKIEEHDGKEYLMTHDYIIDTVLKKIKEIISIDKK